MNIALNAGSGSSRNDCLNLLLRDEACRNLSTEVVKRQSACNAARCGS